MKSIDRAIENNAEEEEIQDINYGIVDEAKQIETKEPEPSKQDQPDLGNLNEAF
jgi:soluble cytochrome b562